MADVASLRIDVDHRPVDQAGSSLEELSERANALEQALEDLRRKYNALNNANDNVNKSTRAVAFQMKNLQFQLFDIAQTITTMNPLMVLLQQGPQVYQALDGPGGVSAGLKNVGSAIGRLLTPARLIGGTFAAAAAVAVTAWARFDDMQRSTLATVTGMGRGIGATVESFQAMARAAAQAGDLSVAKALEIANAFGRAQAGLDQATIGRFVAATKDFAATYTNGDIQQGQEYINKLILSGAQGLSAWVRTQTSITHEQSEALDRFARTGDAVGAANLVLDIMNGKLAKASEVTSPLVKLWNEIKGAISDAVTALGPYIDIASNLISRARGQPIGTSVSQAASSIYEGARSFVTGEPRRPASYQSDTSESIDRMAGSVRRAQAVSKEASDAFGTTLFGALKKVESGAQEAEDKLTDYYRAINENKQSPRGAAEGQHAFTEELARTDEQLSKTDERARARVKTLTDDIEKHQDAKAAQDDLTDAIARGTVKGEQGREATARGAHELNTYKDAVTKVVDGEKLAERQTLARTQAEKEAVAADQARLSVAGQAISQAQEDALAQGARNRVAAEYTAILRDMKQDLADEAERVKLERDLLLSSADARAKAIAELRTEQQLRRQGFDVNQAGPRAVIEQAGKLAEDQTQDYGKYALDQAVKAATTFSTTLASGLANGKKLSDALKDSIKGLGQSLLSSGIQGALSALAVGNYGQAAISGGFAAAGALLSAFGPSQAHKDRRQQMAQAYIDAQNKANQEIADAETAAVEAAVEAARNATQAADDANRRIQDYQDRMLDAQQDTSTLGGALAVFERRAFREREEELRAGYQGMAALIDAQNVERANIEREFRNRQLEEEQRQVEERQRLMEQEVEAFNQTARSIRAFIDQLKGTTAGGGSPLDRLSEAQQAYQRQLAVARGGDREALSSLTSYAQRLLEAGRDVFASGGGYQQIYQRVIAELESLIGGAAISSGVGAAANSNVPGGAAAMQMSSNTSGDLVGAVSGLRAEIAAFRAENAANTVNIGNAVIAAEHETRDAVVSSGERQAREIRLAAERAA